MALIGVTARTCRFEICYGFRWAASLYLDLGLPAKISPPELEAGVRTLPDVRFRNAPVQMGFVGRPISEGRRYR
ncbi:hypothetical protein ACLOJK_036876 [Asimina triloba]